MKPLRVIQLASYRGNIGDNANVTGTRRLLNQNLGCAIQYTDLEYLEYEPDPRWGGKTFDSEFVNLVNQHDLLLIGGGGFFELAVEDSISGTPINIPFEILEQIKTPIVFYALGFHVLHGLDDNRKTKFGQYLDYLLSSDRILVSLRNDGSLKTLQKIYGDKYDSRVFKCPDGGFFTFSRDHYHPELNPGHINIAIQLAGDGLGWRFPAANRVTGNKLKRLLGKTEKSPDAYNTFLKRLGQTITGLLKKSPDCRIILIPHVPEDYRIINDFIPYIGPPYVRRNLTVAPYVHGQEGHDYVFDLYSKCDLTIGMRFHTNVCSVGLQIPSIGLVTYEQIADLYEELSIPSRAVQVNDDSFEPVLTSLIGQSLRDKEKIRQQYSEIHQKLMAEITDFHLVLKKFLHLN